MKTQMATACVAIALGITGCGVRSTGHVERPEPDAHVVHYETDVAIDPISGELRARSTLTLQRRPDQPETIGLLLNNGLNVVSVSGARVRAHRMRKSDFAPVWNLLEVDVDAPPGGGLVTLEVEYAGVMNMEGGVGGVTPAAIELSVESMWHPLLASFDREMIGRLRFRVPTGWSVVSSGAARAVDGAHEVDMSVPQLDVPIFAAPGLRHWSEGGFGVHSLVAEEAEAAAVLEAAIACGEFLDARFGGVNRLPPVRIVIADRADVALARKNFILLPRVDRDDPVGLHRLLCHELAHYWTKSPGPFTPDHWMSESFAEYTAALYVRERFGEDSFRRLVADYTSSGDGQGPVWRPETSARPSHAAMYKRGPYLLSRLDERIGSTAFAEVLRRYMVFEVRTTPELLGHLATVAGADTELWFRGELASD